MFLEKCLENKPKKAPGHRYQPAVGSSFSVGGSGVNGLPDFEGEGHPAIGVDGDVVQQACPEAFPESGDLAVLLLQELHGASSFDAIVAAFRGGADGVLFWVD